MRGSNEMMIKTKDGSLGSGFASAEQGEGSARQVLQDKRIYAAYNGKPAGSSGIINMAGGAARSLI
jgi:hypothetical protein